MKSHYEELSIDSIELDIDNPRIKMYLSHVKEVTAEDLALALGSTGNNGSTSFSALQESIRVNKGIINPILVNHTRDNRYVVIEGNTRLQIYRELLIGDPEGPWKTIRSIVYEDLSSEEIHSIRLQCHLVGPRDWDPYSKAKYLNQLYNVDKLPMNLIISYCGGNSKISEIKKLIDAYSDMKHYYEDKAKSLDLFDHRDFSKFSELQNKSVITSIIKAGFTKQDFVDWVLNRNIDKAENIRKLPEILKEKVSKDEFLKTNITEAYKKIFIHHDNELNINNVDYITLSKALIQSFEKISFNEVKLINNENDEQGRNKKNILESLLVCIQDILDI